MLLRLIVLIIYGVGCYFLQNYFRRNPPEFSKEYVYPESRMPQALYRLAVPLLGPVLGFMWLDIAPISPLLTILFFIVLPLCFAFLPWLWHVKLMNLIPLLLSIVALLCFLLFASLIWILLGGTFGGKLGAPLLLIPMIVFMLLPPLFMAFVVYMWAPDMLPLTAEEKQTHHQDTLELLIGFFTTYPKPSVAVVDGEIQHKIKGNPFLGSGPGLVITEPENTVVLRGGFDIKGIIGPGVIFTEKGQVTYQALDLQRQFRSTRIDALTRDGIQVEVPCGTSFQIDSGQAAVQIGEPWPYRKSAAFTALFASEVDPEGKTPLEAHEVNSWKELTMQAALHKLRQIVASYSLDELYSTTLAPSEKLTRLKMGKEVRDFVERELPQKGIQVLSAGVGNKIIPTDPNVVKQRIETWKANWIRKTMHNEGVAKADYMEQMGRVRSNILNEMLLSLIQQSQALENAGGTISTSLITLRLLETLENMARDPQIQPLLLDSTLPYLRSLRQRALEGQGKPGGAR